MKHGMLATAVVLAWASAATAQTIVVVRHAERADAVAGGEGMMKADPGPCAGGRRPPAKM